MIPIALQLYTVRDDLVEDPVRTIETVAEIGYQGVEGGTPTGMSNKDYLSLLNDNNLTLIGSGTSTTGLRDNLPKTVENCAELGINTLMCGIGGELRQNDGDWKRVVAELAEGCAKASEVGLRILYHNHAFEFEDKVDGQYGLDYLFDTIPEVDIQAELDTYWIKAGGEDPVAYINKYAGRLPRLHIKDQAPANEECPFAEIGHGILSWDEIFSAASLAGIEWYVVEQGGPDGFGFEIPRQCLDALREMGK